MAVGLFWNDNVHFDKHDWKMKFFWVGNNTGNLVFIRALKNIFNPIIFPLWDVDSGAFRDDPSVTHYVTTELIWLTENTVYPHVWKMLDGIGDKPLVPISVGVHSRTESAKVNLNPDTVKLLRTISERAVLGVRGEYTAAVLERLGVLNLQIIGCPSLYYGMDDSFRLDKQPFREDMKAAVNFRTFYGSLQPAECEFLTFAANQRLPFVEQTQQELTLENCQNNAPQFEYLSRWLDEQKRVFFEIGPWTEWLRQIDFSIGSRFHGNVLAIMNGIPALTMVIDGRMQELTNFFRLPTMDARAFSMNRPLSYYYDLADFTEFNRVYPQRLASFRDFLRRNGLTEAMQA
ncbi:MAG: polysaccharide pyruvyl transferase family protein [Clostridia bacterium]|nr:polysaccharide pyruvyl transferase family protein [Clostridia bacterium]